MGLALNLFSGYALCLLVLLPSALCGSYNPYTRSRAAFYGSPDGLGTPSGSCGYGDYGRTVNYGVVAAASKKLYRNGAGCALAIRTLRQKWSECGGDRPRRGDRTDFILSPRGFAKLALPNKVSELKKYGVVDIEYQRVSCQYPGHNIAFMVQEQSRYPDYLAIVITYKGGQEHVIALELLQGRQWVPLKNVYGAVWDISNPPRTPLTLRFQLSGTMGWYITRDVIPSYWRPGILTTQTFSCPRSTSTSS
ncbi:hypothetical protein Sjap_004568 [Stephania japonica]|uniref:Expansin-like B1 n=1 Tax=Stephania japonica TaxID=461633 RepID=A0AAP0K3H1_9MAGN